MKTVLVEWSDCVSYDAWDSIAEHQERTLHTIQSVGFLLSKTKESVIIIQNIDLESGDGSMSMSIPMSMVKSIKVLK